MTSKIPTSLGYRLRSLRDERGLPLRKVAAAVDMDSTLLSKIELGTRLPTQPQTAKLAGFYDLDSEELEAERLSAEFWNRNSDNPAAARAALILHESASTYGQRGNANP